MIKESVRICPPATGILSKKTPPQGDTINGRYVPGGIDIGQCAWGIQRSKAVYGEDSMLFRPERWLEANGADLEKMEKSLNLAWGYGKYSCLGKSISWLEMNKVIFEVSFRLSWCVKASVLVNLRECSCSSASILRLLTLRARGRARTWDCGCSRICGSRSRSGLSAYKVSEWTVN